MEKHVVVLIAAPSKSEGEKIANTLLEQKLAACVNIVSPVQSLYVWEGEICSEEEALLIVKTKAAVFEGKLVPAVQALHPYEVPEIIALPVIMGSERYLDWIDEEVAG
jgi:periplasmic divalent cation tolerance protein